MLIFFLFAFCSTLIWACLECWRFDRFVVSIRGFGSYLVLDFAFWNISVNDLSKYIYFLNFWVLIFEYIYLSMLGILTIWWLHRSNVHVFGSYLVLDFFAWKTILKNVRHYLWRKMAKLIFSRGDFQLNFCANIVLDPCARKSEVIGLKIGAITN